MKYYYLFYILLTSISINAQTSCDDANYYLVSAYSHVKDSYDSNNISHLKYYANRSVESSKLSKEKLDNCNCQKALDLADKSIDLLAKVENAKTFEDGRFFVKRARDITKAAVIEIDKCGAANYNENDYADVSIADENSIIISLSDRDITNESLSNIEREQIELEKQHAALKLKAEQIQTKIAQQKTQELVVKKKSLIAAYDAAIIANIETYNKTLSTCDCSDNILESIKIIEDISTKSITDIKASYMNSIKSLTTSYLSKLNSCQ